MSRRLLAILLLSLSVMACSPLTVVSGVSPLGPVERERNIVFNSHELTLDVYALPGDVDSSRSVIVFFFGGAWQNGAKQQYKFVASTLARQGYVVVIPDYRLYPEVVFPAFVEDAAEATHWTFENIHRYGGDPGNVFLMGHSAGAQIAALLHYDTQYLARAGADAKPCGFIGLAGPYDFLPLVGGPLTEIFPADSREASQPIHFVNGDEGAALLIHGYLDSTVKPRNSGKLANVIENAGGTVELKIEEKRKHAGVLLALARPLTWLAPITTDVSDFVDRQRCGN